MQYDQQKEYVVTETSSRDDPYTTGSFAADRDTNTPEGMRSYLSRRLMMAAPCLSDSWGGGRVSSVRVGYLYAGFIGGSTLIRLGGWNLDDNKTTTFGIRSTPPEFRMTGLSMVQSHALDVLVFSGDICRRHASQVLSVLRGNPALPLEIVKIATPRVFSGHQIMQAHIMAKEANLGRALAGGAHPS